MHIDVPADVPAGDPPEPEAPMPEPATLGRGRRQKRPTWKIIEQRTAPPIAAQVSNTVPDPTPSLPAPQFESQSSVVDHYGLYSSYLASTPSVSRTQFIPTPITFVEPATRVPISLRQQLGAPDIVPPPVPPDSQTGKTDNEKPDPLDQCSNDSCRLIMQWHWSKPVKSLEDTNWLVHQVLLNKAFHRSDLLDFDARRETKLIDKAIAKHSDGWKESSVNISVPDGHTHTHNSDTPVPAFSVPGLFHRSITEIMKSVWSSEDARAFQYVPFRQFWTRGNSGTEEQVFGELFCSEVFNEAYETLQMQPPEPNCQLERVICALMLYSDSTHLANFGDAALWPLYMFFGNQSKYVRVQPSSGSCHHVAYIPKVSWIYLFLV